MIRLTLVFDINAKDKNVAMHKLVKFLTSGAYAKDIHPVIEKGEYGRPNKSTPNIQKVR